VNANANANGPRASAYGAQTRRSPARSQRPHRLQPVADAGRSAGGGERGAQGRLSPWAAPVTGALGWQVITSSRRLAATMAAMFGGKAHPHGKGHWRARIPQTALLVVVTDADSKTLSCRLGCQPDSGILTVAFTPWTPSTVLKCSATALPARGTLLVRDMRITTRMGRTVRYLVPEFIPS
jgi:hypothetical protein